MGYREELEAAQAKSAQLEQELAEARGSKDPKKEKGNAIAALGCMTLIFLLGCFLGGFIAERFILH